MVERLLAGRFELLDVVGSGAFGVVWRAYDWKHRKLVAVKVFTSQGSEPELIHRFVQEQGFRLSHPNVLAPLDFFSDSEKAALVMDLADGGSLEQLLAGGRPTLSTAVAILEQLLEGVAYVHSQGIVHRDIKPANVLLDADERGQLRVRLSDFGHALPTDGPRLTAPTNVVGTPGYIAPELYRFEDASPRSDLYSVGAVAYQLLTGNQPAPPLHNLAANDPAVPATMRAWLISFTQPEPSARPAAADQALIHVRSAATGVRVATPRAEARLPAPPRPRHQMRRRRRRALGVVAGVAAVAAVAFGGTTFTRLHTLQETVQHTLKATDTCAAFRDSVQAATAAFFSNTRRYPTTVADLIHAPSPYMVPPDGITVTSDTMTGDGWTLIMGRSNGTLQPTIYCSSR